MNWEKREAEKRGEKRGEKLGKKKIAKEMLKNSFKDDVIIKLTDITKEELEKIKKEIKK